MIRLNFYCNGAEQTEYIPRRLMQIEIKAYMAYRRVLDYLGYKHYYYHYRSYYPGPTRKKEDFRFMIHVINDHKGNPVDPTEARHYQKLRNLYYPEFDYFIAPYVVDGEVKNGIEDIYVRSYYKRWITKRTSPEIKRMYHGVDAYELAEILPIVLKQSEVEFNRLKSRIKYHEKRAKKQIKKINK